MRKCENISPYMRRPLVIYGFATAPLWISLYMRKIWFSFLSVYNAFTHCDTHIPILCRTGNAVYWKKHTPSLLSSHLAPSPLLATGIEIHLPPCTERRKVKREGKSCVAKGGKGELDCWSQRRRQLNRVGPQINYWCRGTTELVQHFSWQGEFTSAQERSLT